MSRFDPIETISRKNVTPLTQVERIVAHMFDHPERIWWFAGDFMQPRLENTHKHFVGYEASARLTDAISRFNEPGKPALFLTEKQEKFRVVRINWAEFRECLIAYPALIKIADQTDIMRRYEGLSEEMEAHRPKPPKAKFKSYG